MLGARTAWVVAGVAGLLTVADTAMVAAAYELWSIKAIGIHGWPLVNIAAMGTAVIGAVILGSHPRHPIGRLLNLIGLTTSISIAAESYGLWVLEYGGPGSAAQGHLGSWTAAVLGGPLALAALTVVFLVVPAGTYLAPGWRWVARVGWAGYAAFVAGLVLIGPSRITRNGDAIEAGPVARILLTGSIVLIALMILASVVSIGIRLRRSSGVVRDQVRVVGFGAAFVGLALVTLILGQSLQDGRQSWWSSVPLFASYAFLIVCLAVAVLRYRLYETSSSSAERSCSRSPRDSWRSATSASSWRSAAPWAVGPMAVSGCRCWPRWWWQWPSSRPDGASSGSRIGSRTGVGPLRTTRSPSSAGGSAAARCRASCCRPSPQPPVRRSGPTARSSVSTVTRRPGWPPPGRLGPTDPAPGDGSVVVPVQDAAGILGSISLTLPPGRDVRPVEQRLLSDIAEQAALALRNVRLQIEVAARIRQLDQRTRQLAASRSRIIGAADTERRRLEAEIGRSVLPTMGRLREEIGGATTDAVEAERIGDWVDRVTEALDSLRELTRGIYPTMLTRSGLGPALTSHAARAQRAGSLRIDPGVTVARYPARVEAAAYFCCVECARAAWGRVGLDLDGGELVLTLHGVGLDALDRLAIIDRVEACEGSLDVPEPHDAESSLRVRLPVGARPDRPPQRRTTAAAGVTGPKVALEM